MEEKVNNPETQNEFASAATAKFRWSPLFPRRMTPSSTNDSDNTNQPDTKQLLDGEENLYPNCDPTIWLRTCTEEVLKPIEGVTKGTIPKWLKGSLLRNGAGSMKVGEMTFDHAFDGLALLHRFAVADGRVTYQNRFLQSQTFKRNTAARRIVVTEFGTSAVPDPCQSIFQRVSAVFKPGEGFSDNAMISIYPFGDEYYTFTESPVIHRIDPSTLETLQRVNVYNNVNIVSHTSHPHVMPDGTVFNMGLTVTAKAMSYAIVEFPPAKCESSGEATNTFEQATIQSKVPAQWPLHPSYMHTFGFTDNFFVIVEQPMSVSIPSLFKSQFTKSSIMASFRWYPEERTKFHLVCRKTGKVCHQFVAEAFFYFHIINCYEQDQHVVIDICCYRDPSLLESLYVESLKGMQKNPDYASLTRSRPLRFVLPLSEDGPEKGQRAETAENLVSLEGSEATAFRLAEGIIVYPEPLCHLGCELPRLNQERHAGKPYRFFYAIASDVDLDNPGTLIKVDTATRSTKIWCEEKVYPSEPIFVPSPDPKAEDDGVVLSALVWSGTENENKVALLVLDASTWKELGRTEFATPSPVPKGLHGWFMNSY